MLYEDLGVHKDSNSQSGNSLENVKVHSLTFFCTPRGMKCDSCASLLARTFANPYLGREPKAKVATIYVTHLKNINNLKVNGTYYGCGSYFGFFLTCVFHIFYFLCKKFLKRCEAKEEGAMKRCTHSHSCKFAIVEHEIIKLLSCVFSSNFDF